MTAAIKNNKRGLASPAPTNDNSQPVLADLANQINEHEDSRRACQLKGLMHAIRIGQLLIEAKQVTPHGQFLNWMEDNLTVTPRMGQNYMKIAEDDQLRDDVECKYETVSHLTINQAVKLAKVRKTCKQHAAKIISSFNDFQVRFQSLYEHCGEVRKTFASDDSQFIRWVASKTEIPVEFAKRLPALLSRQYDEDAWIDALETSFEEMKA